MAAFDSPWAGVMSKSSFDASGVQSPLPNYDPNPPTIAAFAPTSNSGYSASSKQRSTVIVHKKSPLLVATPPQITRALAHSHPFILILNKFVGLLSWSTGDPWESFLLVAAFWAGCLYGGEIVRYGTPLNVVAFLILGMWLRRYSPLSSKSRTKGIQGNNSHKQATSTPQHKSLDEIVGTLIQFTARCNILLDPFVSMTDFLSTQRTATSATTRPALTTLLIRIILVLPLWVVLTLPPFYILSARRTIISIGTILLTWHSKPAKVSRVILWRSVLVRKVTKFVTGLDFDTTFVPLPAIYSDAAHSKANELASASKKRRPASSGIQFTFVLYENQRRWIGLGWTTSLFAYERSPWTDEHLNPASAKEEFELPAVDGGHSRWRWVKGSTWQIETVFDSASQQKGKSSSSADKRSSAKGSTSASGNSSTSGGKGWIYYDNKWNDGRAEDGWGRYTRRRKWFRDAELVEVTASMENSAAPTPTVQSDVELDESEIEKEKIRRAKNYAKSLNSVVEKKQSRIDQEKSNDLSSSVATIVPEEDQKARNRANATGIDNGDAQSTKSSTTATTTKRRSGWFGRTYSYDKAEGGTATPSSDTAASGSRHTRTGSTLSKHSNKSGVASASASVSKSDISNSSSRSRDGPEQDLLDRWRDNTGQSKNYGVGEDVYMSLG